MSEKERALLRAFIESDASPNGKWWIDVPVGLSIGGEDEYATAAAVCLTSRDQELPEVYPDHDGVSYVSHPGNQDAGVTKADAFQTLREMDRFTDETAVIVATDSGASSVGSVGELLAYQDLLEADWDWTVEELILVSDVDSAHVNHVCRERGVRAVRVT